MHPCILQEASILFVYLYKKCMFLGMTNKPSSASQKLLPCTVWDSCPKSVEVSDSIRCLFEYFNLIVEAFGWTIGQTIFKGI